MSFADELLNLSQRLPSIRGKIDTEEATKNALVMPFLAALGYDVFNPSEVIPEFTADVGIKKGEKVDYAVMHEGEIIILVECKPAGSDLTDHNTGQLFRYFSVTNARIAILTSGIKYRFFSDLEKPNRMDDSPFLELDLEDLREDVVAEVAKLDKQHFDLDRMLSSAADLKYLREITQTLTEQAENPDAELVRFFFGKASSTGRFTASAKDQFTEILRKAFQRYIRERVSSRLRSALAHEADTLADSETDEDISDIVTTKEEIESFHIVKAIVTMVLKPHRIVHRDMKSYFGILCDNNNRKPICRLHFNSRTKYIGLFDEQKNETRHPVASPDDIYKYSEQLRATALRYA